MKNKLDVKPEEKYLNYGWTNYYDFLNIPTDSFPNIEEYYKIIKKLKSNNNIRTEKDLLKIASNENIPSMPKEFYGCTCKNFKDIKYQHIFH